MHRISMEFGKKGSECNSFMKTFICWEMKERVP